MYNLSKTATRPNNQLIARHTEENLSAGKVKTVEMSKLVKQAFLKRITIGWSVKAVFIWIFHLNINKRSSTISSGFTVT